MPLLTRTVGTPLTIDIGPGAVEGLGPLLADRRISAGGHVAVIVGPGLGEEIATTLRPSLEDHGRKGSYGVQMPIAVMVDLDYVRRSDPALRRGGVGDVISNLSAIADWRLAERERGEAVDGLAATFAHTAAMARSHAPSTKPFVIT